MATRRRRITKNAPSAKDYEDDYDDPADDEEYEDERPSRRRRRAAEDEDEDRPARRRSRARDDDDDEEEERPRRGRRRARDDDDDEEEERQRPSRRTRSRDDDDDDDDDDDEDDRRSSKKGKSATKGAPGGWGRAMKEKEKQGDWAKELKLGPEAQVIKFIDDEPFTVWRQHWLDNIEGKKSYYCLQSEKLDCPLCDIGDSTRVYASFNVLLLEGDDEPELNVFSAATRLTTLLESKGKGRQGPLTNGYWAVSRSGKGNKTSYSVDFIKERDLEEDWDVVPLEEDDVEAFEDKLYTKETFPEGRMGARDLKKLAAELVDDD